MTEESIDPIALFEEGINSLQPSVRINTVWRIPLIVAAVSGSTFAKENLMEILLRIFENNDDDEMIFAIASSLSGFDKHYELSELFEIYGRLLVYQEQIIREVAIRKFAKSIIEVDGSVLQIILPPFIDNLMAKDSLGMRLGVCSLFTVIVDVLNQSQVETLWQKVVSFLGDEALVFKRHLARQLGKMTACQKSNFLIPEMAELLCKLLRDESDSVRIACLQSVPSFVVNKLSLNDRQSIVGSVIELAEDCSWRVRLQAAECFDSVMLNAAETERQNTLVSFFTLINDPEREVQIASIKVVPRMVPFLNPEDCLSLLAVLENSSKHYCFDVRLNVCLVLSSLAQSENALKVKQVFVHKLTSILEQFLGDKCSEIKQEAFGILPIVAKLSGKFPTELLLTCQPIKAEPKYWRVRVAHVNAVYQICTLLAKEQVFEEHLFDLLFDSLADKAEGVRATAVHTLQSMHCWISERHFWEGFTSRLSQMATDVSNANPVRFSCLYALEAIYDRMKEKDKVKNKLIAVLRECALGGNPDLRFVAVKVLHRMSKKRPFGGFNEASRLIFAELKDDSRDKETSFLIKDL